MRIFNLSARAERAISAALRPAPAPVPVPSFTVRAASGIALDASTATGAFRALRLLTPRDRETAKIYDDDGYCLYR